MENENIVKRENEVVNINNNSKNRNGIIAFLVIIIIALIGLVVYFAFLKKDDKPVDNNDRNSQQQQNNNISTTEIPENTSVISKKMVFNSCKSIVETFNDIKVEVRNAKVVSDAIGCEGEIFIKDNKITNFDGQGIDSIEIYDKYVIVYGGTSASGKLAFYDTKNNNKLVEPDLGKYFQSQGYISDDEGLIVIAASHAGENGAPEPEHYYRKLRIKYSNGSFGVPEIIEEYDEYRKLVK